MKHNSMKHILTFLLLFCIGIAHAETITVVDAIDGTPISGATVFASSGMVLGYTDTDGNLNIESDSCFPLEVSSTGYSPEKVSEPGTVAMQHLAYNLPELNVDAAARPVRRTICYVRQYVTTEVGADSAIFYNQMMMEFFDAPKKTKGFSKPSSPRILNQDFRCWEKDAAAGTDTVYSFDEREIWMEWDMFMKIPTDVPSKEGPELDVEQGEYTMRSLIRRTPTLLRQRIDYLADEKNHNFAPGLLKLMGLGIDMTRNEKSYIYDLTREGELTPEDLVGGKVDIEMAFTGRLFKKAMKNDSPVTIYISYEYYPVETEYLTVADAKAIMKDKDLTVPLRPGPLAPAPPESIRKLGLTKK